MSIDDRHSREDRQIEASAFGTCQAARRCVAGPQRDGLFARRLLSVQGAPSTRRRRSPHWTSVARNLTGRSRNCGRTSIRGQPRAMNGGPTREDTVTERRLCGLSEKRDISRSRKRSKPTNQADSAQPILGIAGRGVRHIKSEVLQINTSTQRTVISKLPHSFDRRVILQRATRMGFTPRPAC